MRPTECNFTSPKNRTGEYVYPNVTASGINLLYEKTYPIMNSPMKHTMSLERRFKKRFDQEKRDR